jgi:mitochondrial import inner membrane translocase subunit TIM44
VIPTVLLIRSFSPAFASHLGGATHDTIMSALRQAARTTSPATALRSPSLALYSLGRSPASCRLQSSLRSLYSFGQQSLLEHGVSRFATTPSLTVLRPNIAPATISVTQSRLLHSGQRLHQEQAAKNETKPTAQQEAKPAQAATGEQSEAKPESEEQGKKQEGEEEGKKADEEQSEEGKKEEKKEDLPPPPPHGDKTPWQVFMETMQTELKASKEWNDSTKQLAAGAKEFSESESVQRARKAYESTTGAVSNTAGRVLKSTGDAIGKGASWTWETPVMKGVRKGANYTGEALDKATKPIRETEAYKNVKNVIDDGSSSRYGGWTEKEERRRARELREQKAASIHGRPEDMVEDPK